MYKKASSGHLLSTISVTDRWGYIVLGIILLAALVIGLSDETMFNDHFAEEDGLVENLTALVLLCIAILCGVRIVGQWKSRSWMWLLGTTAFMVLFFFAAGEEISWGQRIFGWESGEYFQERNAQSETNLHNLVVGDTKLNKLIFTQLLGLVMLIYLFLIPMLYRKNKWIKNIIDRFAVPVVHWHHAVAFVLVTGIVLIIPADRKWEVYELAFGLIFFLIFLNSLNREVFRIKGAIDKGSQTPGESMTGRRL